MDKPRSGSGSGSALAAVARLKSRIGRSWRELAAHGPFWRWLPVLVGVALALFLGYVALPVPVGSALLRNGQKFSSGDILKVSRALDTQQIEYRVDDQGRIEVASDRLEDARAALAKLSIGPRSIDELSKDALAPHPWDDLWDREQRQVKAREEILAAMIRNLDGIVSVYVTLNRPRSRGVLGLRPSGSAGASAGSVAGPGPRNGSGGPAVSTPRDRLRLARDRGGS